MCVHVQCMCYARVVTWCMCSLCMGYNVINIIYTVHVLECLYKISTALCYGMCLYDNQVFLFHCESHAAFLLHGGGREVKSGRKWVVRRCQIKK